MIRTLYSNHLKMVSVYSVSSCLSRLTDDDQIRSSNISINGRMNEWKCKLIFPTDTLDKSDIQTFLRVQVMFKITAYQSHESSTKYFMLLYNR